jgi:predicted amidohydrolase YtcJ
MSPPPGKSVSELDGMFRDWGVCVDGSGFGDSMLRLGGIFVQAGGKPQIARFTTSEAPYTGWASYYYNAFTPEEIRQIALLAAKYGLRVNTIADTQRALDFALDVYEEVNRTYPINSRRWVIEHLEEVSLHNILRMKNLGVIPTAIPGHSVWKNGSHRAREISDRGEAVFAPYKAILDSGLPLTAGTDNSPPNPFICLWSMVARKASQTDDVLIPGQRLDRKEALRAMTINGAYLTFDEHIRGSIEQGKYADMVVLEEDYMEMPEDSIQDIRILSTIVGGGIVYQR